MVTRNITITDPVGIHARPAAQFAQAVAASGCNVTIAKEAGAAVPAGSILSIMGLGVQQGDTVQITVEGDNAETVADSLTETPARRRVSGRNFSHLPNGRPACPGGRLLFYSDCR